MSSDALYPLSFEPGSLTVGASDYFQAPSFRLLVTFFRTEGLEALKQENREERQRQDWIDY